MATFAVNEVARRTQFTSTGQAAYAFNFQVNATSEVEVHKNDTLQTLSTHYNVTLNTNGTGTVTFIDNSGSGGTNHTPSSGDIITIIGDLALSRTTVLNNAADITTANLDLELDNVLMRQQQLKEMMDRSIQLKVTTPRTVTGTGTSGPLQFPYDGTASNNANRIIKFDSNGTSLELGSTTTNIDSLATVITEIGLLGNSDTIADMALLGTSAVVADLNLLADSDVIADMALLADSDVISDMNTLATSDIVSDLNTLATSDFVSDLNTLATSTNVSNIDTVSGAISNVNTVAGAISNVNLTATNISGVNSFAERYRVGSSDPSSSLDEGDLFYNSSDNVLKFYNGSSWQSLNTSGLNNIVEDTSPQLGGNLDVQAREINTSTTNANIILAPDGTGMLEVKGNTNAGTIQLNCENNSHGVKIKGPPHSAAQSYTLTLPSSITNNYYLKTDGSGNLSFAEVPTETKPTVSDVSQTIAPATATTINITGTNFVTVPIVEFIKTDGSITRPNSVSFTSATSLSVNVTLASGNYHVRVENPDGNAGRSTNNIITASTAPSFSTSAGSLGEVAAGSSVSLDVDASSDSTVAFSETTSVLTSNSDTPASTMNLTLNSSTGAITGTAPSPTSDTTYNFTLRATDAESQTADRAFSITVSVGMNNSGQFHG